MFDSWRAKGRTVAEVKNDRPSVPFDKLTPRAFDSASNIFFATDGDQHYLGACLVSVPLTGADSATVAKFRAALSMPLPPGSFLQIGNLATPDTEEILACYLNGKDNVSNVLSELSRQHYEFIKSGRDVPLVSHSGVRLMRQRLIITLKVPYHSAVPDSAGIDMAKEYVDRMQEGMKAAGLPGELVNAEGFLALTRLINNPWGKVENHYDPTVPIREQVYFPGDSIKYDDPSTIEFNSGDHFAKLLSVKYFPKKASLAIMNYLIGDPGGIANQIIEPYWMVLTLHYPDQVKKAAWVRARSGMINHQVFGPTAHMIPVLGYKKAGIDTLVHELEGKGAVLCEANLSLWLFSRDRSRLNKAVAGLLSYYTSLGFEFREDRRILEAMWHTTMPLNPTVKGISQLFRFHTMAISHAVQFLPIIGEWRGSGVNGAVMCVTRRGQPVLFDLFESSTNYNGVIFAESGAGKSVLAQKIISDYLAQGAKVWTIDVGGSYYKLARATGGMYMEFSTESDICLNPFTNIEGDLDEEMDILKATIAKMAAPEETLNAYAMSLLEQAITSVYKKFGTSATVTAVAEWCIAQQDPEAQRLGKQLYPFAGGTYTRWFDGVNNLDMDNAFVVLELEALKGRKALQQVVLLQLISRINFEMYRTRGRRKLLILDEAWELLDDPMMAKAMEAAYRKARKHDCAVLVVTQSIADLYNSKNSEAIAANSAWQLILQQKEESIDAAIEGGQFKIDPYGAHMLKGVHTLRPKYSEVMIKRSGDNWGIVRLVVNRFQGVMFSTSGAERDDILNALDRGEDAVETINAFIAAEEREAVAA